VIPFCPYLLFAVLYAVFFATPRYHWGSIYASFARVYSYSHAIFSTLFGGPVAWIASGAKHTGVSAAFRQATLAVGAYVIAYVGLIAFAFRFGLIHLLDYDYYGVEFWLFYNVTLSSILLWVMYRTIEDIKQRQCADGALSRSALTVWQLRTGCAYLGLLTSVFIGIILL